jgi:hypothetical protein
MPRRDDHGFVDRHRRAPARATAARRQPPDITASGGIELLLDEDEESSAGASSRHPLHPARALLGSYVGASSSRMTRTRESSADAARARWKARLGTPTIPLPAVGGLPSPRRV